MKTVVILQSNYIPWRGYFDLVKAADLFVFHDDLQYTKGDWRNRNRILTPRGPEWLTIPTGTDEHRLICEVEISDQHWKQKHRRRIEESYRSAPYFEPNRSVLDFLYDNSITNLSDYNQRAIREIARRLSIETNFGDSRSLHLTGTKTERVVSILQQVHATRYISGPAGKNYLDIRLFEEAGIALEYFSYDAYREYPQLHAPFRGDVSILDLIFNVGPDASTLLLTR